MAFRVFSVFRGSNLSAYSASLRLCVKTPPPQHGYHLCVLCVLCGYHSPPQPPLFIRPISRSTIHRYHSPCRNRPLRGFATRGEANTPSEASAERRRERGESLEDIFSSCLDTAGMPDPDLIVRTSGELRISNFLLWQAAYAEFYFTNVLWPDFDKAEFDKAIASFSKRERRMGGRLK